MSDSRDLYDQFVGSLGQGPLVKPDAFFFGVVTQVRPVVKVRLDGDSSDVGSTPIMLVKNAAVGSRVLCQLHGRQLIVVSTVSPTNQDPDDLGNVTSVHLDTLLETHTYRQTSSPAATASKGYPVGLAGLLEVVRASEASTVQRYTAYNGASIWVRTYYNGTWNPWMWVGGPPAGQAQIQTFSSNFVGAAGTGDNPVLNKKGGMVQLTGRVRQTAGFTGGVAFNVGSNFLPAWQHNPTRLVVTNGGNTPGPQLSGRLDANGDYSINRTDNSTSPGWDANTWIVIEFTYIAAS